MLESIKLYRGEVIDGRNRYRACLLAGKAPHFEDADVNGSAADYVYAMNNDRRHLNPGARAIAAAKYKKQCAVEAKERQRQAGKTAGKSRPKDVATLPQANEGKSRDAAGKKFDVSGRTVDTAETVLRDAAPEVIAAVESGELPVATAARLSAAPKSEQRKAVAGGKSAVRDAINKHSPSVNDEARSDAGVKISKTLRQMRMRIALTREQGGIKALTARWTPEQTEEYLGDISEMIKELQTWEIALTTKLRKS